MSSIISHITSEQSINNSLVIFYVHFKTGHAPMACSVAADIVYNDPSFFKPDVLLQFLSTNVSNYLHGIVQNELASMVQPKPKLNIHPPGAEEMSLHNGGWLTTGDKIGQIAFEGKGGSYKISSMGNQTEKLKAVLPGLDEYVKPPPSDCQENMDHSTDVEATVWDIVQSLNDCCGWSREKIADWLETLDADLKFKPKEEENEQD